MAKAGDGYRELVGTVMAALDIGSAVKTEQWITGPDGERDMDVEVRGTLNGLSHFVLVECKDHLRPIGIGYIDAFESKIRDLQPNRALMFSNSGFTRNAKKKAKRVHIELASAMKAKDNKIRVQVHRKVIAKCITLRFEKATLFPYEGQLAQVERNWQVSELLFDDLPVTHWLNQKMQELALQHEEASQLCFLCTFSYSQGWSYRGMPLIVGGLKLQFHIARTWVAQTVREDVSLGYYDHLRKCVVVPSRQWYSEGIYDQEAWEETDSGWDCKELEPNSFRLSLTLIRTNLQTSTSAPPNVETLIVESKVDFESAHPIQ